jgi:hypothetical protein
MGRSITAADAVYMLSIETLYLVPQQLQEFSADDVFGTDPLENAEISMGVDGNMAAGFVFVPVRQSITLQGSSDSALVFDDWYAAEQALKTKLFCQAVIVLKSIGKKWTMNNGVLSTYPPIPDAKKVLQPRRFGITWESVSPAIV